MRCLDNVIDLNAYPNKETEITAKKYRAVWLGTLWVAEYLAENKIIYGSQESVELIDKVYKDLAYYTLRSSVDIAKERWAYPEFEWSEFSKWVVFWKECYKLWDYPETDMEWANLWNDMKKYWTRFGYHSAPAPNTSTSLVVGTTAGVVPVYKKYFVETNQISPTVTVAPNLNEENFWYYPEYVSMELWGVIDVVSTIQKWIDQSVSFEWLINPQKTTPKDLYNYYMKGWKQWLKTVYYVRSQSLEVDDCTSCSW
jgi:ribonucleoside-diphosphate reductase alpha chain